MLRFLLISLLLVLAIYLWIDLKDNLTFQGQVAQKAAYPQYESLIDAYDQFFAREMRRSHTPGAAIVIVVDSTILFAKGYGVKKVGTKDSIDEHTAFRIGSLSKGFTGVLSGILVDNQSFDWNDRVVKHLPDFQLKSSKYTLSVRLEHLLSHTSGLPYHMYTNLVEDGADIEQIATQLAVVNHIAPPGKVYAYQNVAFGIMEMVFLATKRQPFEFLMNQYIWEPASMNDASASYNTFMQRTNKAFPHYFDRRRGRYVSTPITEKYYNLPSAGGINASIYDMGQWMKVLLGNRPEIIDSSRLAEVFEPMIETDIKNRYFYNWSKVEKAHYGKGWRILEFPNDTLIYHGGYVNEYRGEIAIHPKAKIGICALFNAPSGLSGYCIPEFWAMWEAHQNQIKRHRSFEGYLN